MMDYMTLLSTRKPTGLHRLVDTVPPPAYSVPRGGLPQWHSIPLDRQIPYTRIPHDLSVVFAKNRLGNKLYPQPPGSEFDTWPGTVPEYDPLHDPHLRPFFRQCRSLVLPPYPPCSQQQYNEHRRRQHCIRAKQIKMEMERRDQVGRDALLFKKVIEEKEKRRIRYFKDEKAKENMRRIMEEQEEERKEKERELQERQKNLELRIIRVQEMKEERKQEVARKARARQEVIRKRVEASREIAMMKKVKNLKRMRLEDIRMKKSLQQARDDRVKKRQEEDLRRWNELWRSQQERTKQRAEMLQAYTEQLNKRVAEDLRNKAATQAQRDRHLEVIQRTNMKPWADRERDYARELRHKLSNNWREEQEQPALRKERKPYPARSVLREAVQSGVCGRSSSNTTLDRAGFWMKRWQNVPDPVRSALNAVMGRTILTNTKHHVGKMLKEVYNRALHILKNFIAAATQSANPDHKLTRGKRERKGEITLTESQQILQQDNNDETNAKSPLERAIVRSRKVMTQVISEHIHRGMDATTLSISTLPRMAKEPSLVTEDESRLAMLVCHTRAIDININTDLVKTAAEKILILALHVINKETHKSQ